MLLNESKMEEPTIKPIHPKAVHRISSGQVVLNLATAVKELVENAIDALATHIEVRLRDYGLESVEVIDNGIGVREDNFQSLTLKHCTSKLRDFSDLETIATLGFRGEALSSLCALSNLTITTRHSSADHATTINYDCNGQIVSSSPMAREFGTSVLLRDLFVALPVRRKEFTKNNKREFNKMCQLLNAYCLIARHIKIICSNHTNAGRKTILTTTGASSIRENIISVFGPNQVASLINVEMITPEDPILEEYNIKENLQPPPFAFEFLISNATHGSGRSATDRQFLFINSRPCELNSATKLINDVYKQFNINQYPFVCLAIEMRTQLVDVNVTPDKRKVFLEQEKLLLAYIKASLLRAFQFSPSTFTLQNTSTLSSISISEANQSTPLKGLKRVHSPAKNNQTVLEEFVIKKPKPHVVNGATDSNEEVERVPSAEKSAELTVCPASTPSKAFVLDLSSENSDDIINDSFNQSLTASEIDVSSQMETNGECRKETLKEGDNMGKDILNINDSYHQSLTASEIDVANKMETNEGQKEILKENDNKKKDTLNINELLYENMATDLKQEALNLLHKNKRSKNLLSQSIVKKTITIKTSMASIKEQLLHASNTKSDDKKIATIKFRSEIKPETNKNAEKELMKQITKEDFQKMDIIGQFNLGFIIAKLDDDLFIIDQHASDEKYNFEQLQHNTTLEYQMLVNPKLLELTPGNETLLIANQQLFEKNGFRFKIDTNAPCTKRVYLTSIPTSKNCYFGKDDIDEMLFMLQNDGNLRTCLRPSRIRAMFASRACRKSVMIGSPLTNSDMTNIVNHMGEIEQPWNCPHGRPTMRHLINLRRIS